MNRIARRSAFGVLTGLTIVMSGACAANAATITLTPDPVAFGDVTVGSTDTIVATATFTPDPGFSEGLWSVNLGVALPSDAFSETNSCSPSLTCVVDISFSPTNSGSFTDTILLGALDSNGSPGGTNTTTAQFDISGTGIVPAATPLPATLPLFATGLGALGLLGWRRKRKSRVSLLGAA